MASGRDKGDAVLTQKLWRPDLRWVAYLVAGIGAAGASFLAYQYHSKRQAEQRRQPGNQGGGKEEGAAVAAEPVTDDTTAASITWTGSTVGLSKRQRKLTAAERRAEDRTKLKEFLRTHAEAVPREERTDLVVEYRLKIISERWNPRGVKCEGCWLTKKTCICQKLEPLDLPVDFIIYMHHREHYRSSNTGRLITMTHPTSIILTTGLPEDEKRLDELYASDPDNMVMLFPAPDSVTWEELMEERKAKGITGRLTVVLPDGTWRQVRTCVRRLPSTMRKVRIQAAAQTRSRLRLRTREDGICSIEAAATLIENIGSHDQAAIMLRHLDKLNEGVIAQTGHMKEDKNRLPKRQQSGEEDGDEGEDGGDSDDNGS